MTEKIESKVDFFNKILIDEEIIILERSFNEKDYQPIIKVKDGNGKTYEYTVQLALDTLNWLKYKVLSQDAQK